MKLLSIYAENEEEEDEEGGDLLCFGGQDFIVSSDHQLLSVYIVFRLDIFIIYTK